jgi:hypothetical protein
MNDQRRRSSSSCKMNSTLSSSLTITLASMAILLVAASCRSQPSAEEKLRSFMESTPFMAPMGYQDITDPQVGYTHSPGGIEGGEFLFVESGDFKSTDQSSPIPIGFRKVSFYGDSQPYLVPGFRPRAAACKYGLRKPGQWSCLLFKSAEDAQRYFESNDKSPVSFVVCQHCKPRPVPMLSRVCPGVYSSSLDKASDWEDPTIPGPVFAKGICNFKLPWWRTPEGIQLGIKKYGDKIK